MRLVRRSARRKQFVCMINSIMYHALLAKVNYFVCVISVLDT